MMTQYFMHLANICQILYVNMTQSFERSCGQSILLCESEHMQPYAVNYVVFSINQLCQSVRWIRLLALIVHDAKLITNKR